MTKLFFVLLLVCQAAFARPLTPEQKLADFNELVGYIQSGYGPLHYKKNRGMDLESLRNRYMPIMRDATTNADFYYAMVRFVAEFNDSHFGASLPTTLETYLGFSTDLVQGMVVIDEVNRDILSLEKFPFQKGDEVVSMNGVPVATILDELQSYMGQGFELSARRRAAFQLAHRRASKVPAQKGNVTVEFRRGGSFVTEKVELTWQKKGKWLDEFSEKAVPSTASLDYDMLSIDEKFRCSGDTRTKIPADATVIMKTPFVAYYYPTAKGNVGYLRIPHYSPTETDPRVDAHALRFSQYEYAVSVLEKNTVGLIIDQDHNCGGSVEWLHKFLSLFMDRTFEPMQFELLANKASVVEFQSWMDAANTSTLEYENLVMVRDLIHTTWRDTANFLTTKIAITGEKIRYPHNVRYTKPIIVLIDELSGSGGDAFPALIQGYGRAKLLGTRTMGAGGHVIELPLLNNSQLKVRMTKSLFYRPDGVPVENNGAVPDISYSPTLNDFKYGYQEYQFFYTNELLKML